MKALYEYLDLVPEFLRRPLATLIIIIFGYFLSKIFAVLATKFIPRASLPEGNTKEVRVPLKLHVSRMVFWSSWLFFVTLALSQFHPELVKYSDLSLNSIDYTQMFSTVLCACILMLSETHITRFYRSLIALIKPAIVSRNNTIIQIVTRLVWIPIFGLWAVFLGLPGTLGNKVALTMFFLLIGSLFSNVLKQTLKSFLQPFGVESNIFPNFTSYFFFVHFLLLALNIWR